MDTLSSLSKKVNTNQKLLISTTVFSVAAFLGTVAVIVLVMVLTQYINDKVIGILQNSGNVVRNFASTMSEGIARGIAASAQQSARQ